MSFQHVLSDGFAIVGLTLGRGFERNRLVHSNHQGFPHVGSQLSRDTSG